MLKRFKSLAIIAIVVIVFAGGSHFVSNAAIVEEESKHAQHDIVTYGEIDERFYEFYKELLSQWNMNDHKHAHKDVETPKEEQTVPESDNDNYIEEEKEQIEQTPVESNPIEEEVTEATSLNAFEREMFQLTNVEREKHGLEPFQLEEEVSKVAREKSRDMAENHYFDHNSPVYGSPFDMMRAYGITYQAAGENIAMGQRSPEEVVQAWMNSPGHRANILNPTFTHMGVGFVENGYHWTQQFISK